MKRIAVFDWLRALAIIFIVLYHYTTRYAESVGHIGSYALNFPHGHMGVTVFFILSGFLALYNFNSRQGIKAYFIKRFTRLYPAYWTAMILTTLVCYFFWRERCVSPTVFLVNLTMLQSFFHLPNVDGAYWFLPLELLFYFYIGLLYKYKLKDKIEILGLTWIIVVLMVNILRLSGINNLVLKVLGALLIKNYAQTFIAGIVMCCIYFKRGTWSLRHKFMTALTLLLCVLNHFLTQGTLYGYFFIVMLGLFYLIALKKLPSIMVPPAVKFIADISYPLFLTHQFIGWVIIRNLETRGCIQEIYLIIPLIIMILVAAVIHFKIEIPIKGRVIIRWQQ